MEAFVSGLGAYTGLFWNQSGTDPNKSGPDKKNHSRMVPCKQKANPAQFSDRIHLEPVPFYPFCHPSQVTISKPCIDRPESTCLGRTSLQAM